jgi:N-acetylglutamate synthase-like GNAT family acetyltransferase
MPDYTIRAATQADANTIKSIVRSNPLDPNAVDWHYFHVLEIVEDGKPVIAAIGMVHPEGDVNEVDSVATVEQYRKRGYAEALVHALIAHWGKPLYLLAEDRLVAYYQKFGFRVMAKGDAPPVMTEQADMVNRWFGDRTTYHVMGLTG